MHPIIFKFGLLTIYSYGLTVAIAFILGIYISSKEAVRKNINVNLIYDLTFYLVIGSLIGARIYYVLFFNHATFLNDPLYIFKLWQGGLAIHGAIFGGITAIWLFSKWRNVNFLDICDITAPSVILGQAIGRIGCFLNGCCFGVPTCSDFGIKFPEGSLPYLAYGDAYLHPTQLYEILLDFLGFLILWASRKKITFKGGIFLLYIILYGAIRLVVAQFRSDNSYVWHTGIKTAQFISVLMIVIGAIIFLKKKKNR